MPLKFEDCRTCRFRRKPEICAKCDVGELYEDEDAPTLDLVFEEKVSRFGEILPDDEMKSAFDADRFLDSLEDNDGSDEQDA